MSERLTAADEQAGDATAERYQQCLFDWSAAHAPLWDQHLSRRSPQPQIIFLQRGDPGLQTGKESRTLC